MEAGLFIFASLLLFFTGSAFGVVHFSSLPRNLVVKASSKNGTVLKAGEDKITVTWGQNQSLAKGLDARYKKITVNLCFAPISQQDRAWRKTNDELQKDKTCQFEIVSRPYSNKEESYEWDVEKDVPTATYFVRAYAIDSNGHQVAYGETTNDKKTINLFEVQAITGRHASIDIAAGCFSAFSIISLFFFFYLEKRKTRKSSTPK